MPTPNNRVAVATLGVLVTGILSIPPAVATPGPDNLVLGGQAVTPTRVADAPMPGWQEVRLPSGEIFYTDPEQRYVIVGTLYENTESRLVNLTELGGREARLETLAALPDEAFVTYSATGDEIGTITVFTDPSCPYCEMLHGDIEALNAAGVSVRYLPFSRMGLNHPVAQQLSEIWCSEGPQDELTAAFNPGRPVHGDEEAWDRCGEFVEQSYVLGQVFGIQGTPAIVLPSGEVGEGYLPAVQLVQAVSLGRERE